MGSRWQGGISIGESVIGNILQTPVSFGNSECGFAPEAEFNKADVAAGSRDFHRSVMTSMSIPGTLQAELDGELIGWILKYLVGAPAAPTETPPASGNYVHTFTPDDFLTEFFVRKIKGKEGLGTAASDKIWGEVKMGSGTFSAASAGKLEGSFDMMARGYTDADALSPAQSFSWLTLAPFVFKGLAPYVDDFAAWPASTSEPTLESFDLSIDHGLITDKRTANGSFLPASFPEGKREIGLTVTKEFEDENMWDDFIGEQEKMLKLLFTGGAIPGGSANYTLSIEIPRAKIIAHDRGGPIGGGNDRLVGTVEMVPLYDATEGCAIRFVLTNSRSAQY